MSFGIYEIVTGGPNPQIFIIDDPAKVWTFHLRGTAVTVETTQLSSAQIAQLNREYGDTYNHYVNALTFIRQYENSSN